MDARKFITCLFLVAVMGLTSQSPVEADNPLVGGDVVDGALVGGDFVDDEDDSSTVPHSTALVETSVTESTPQNNLTTNSPCSTARNKPGKCVMRQECEYSTSAIDFTLYAPKGYVKSCSSEEVCCPLDALIQIVESTSLPSDTDNNFNFDADD